MPSTICTICNNTIQSEQGSNFYNDTYYLCQKCSSDGKHYYTDYMLRATYDIQKQIHDGYYSDAKILTTRYSKTKLIPLTKLIKQEDMDNYGNINPSCKYLNFYNRKIGCKKGDKNCMCENYEKITAAKIIKKKRKALVK